MLLGNGVAGEAFDQVVPSYDSASAVEIASTATGLVPTPKSRDNPVDIEGPIDVTPGKLLCEQTVVSPATVPVNSNPLVKLPLIEAEICAELESIPVDLGKVVFIPEPSP